jgi:hypothetical protein
MRPIIAVCIVFCCCRSLASETYRIVNASETVVAFSIIGNTAEYKLNLPPCSWVDVETDGDTKHRVIVLTETKNRKLQYTHVRFALIPDKHGVGLPIIFIDNSQSLHLLRLGKGSLVLLDRVHNRPVENEEILRAYRKSRGLQGWQGDGMPLVYEAELGTD